MPDRYPSSADTHAMAARLAPVILELLGDGRPRSWHDIVAVLSCLAAERYWDQARWAIGAYARRFDGLERAPRAGGTA